MTAIGWRKRGGSKPLKFTKEKHMSTEAEKQEPACPHIYEPLGCYRVRCQLGRKCVDAQSQPKTEKQEPVTQPKREWVGLTDEEKRQILLDDPIDWINAIETKLREKNNGNSAV